MTRSIRGSTAAMLVASVLLPAAHSGAEDAAGPGGAETQAELSFFEYLGTMVEGEGGWLDPLEIAEQPEQWAIDEDSLRVGSPGTDMSEEIQ